MSATLIRSAQESLPVGSAPQNRDQINPDKGLNITLSLISTTISKAQKTVKRQVLPNINTTLRFAFQSVYSALKRNRNGRDTKW